MIKIGIDLDGGDFNATHNIKAVEDYLSKSINKDVKVYGYTKDDITFKHNNFILVKCVDYISDDDTIISFRRKKESSMVKMINDLKEGIIDSGISAGNSGVLMASSSLILGTWKKNIRAAFAPMLRNVVTNEKMIILDAGANIENSVDDLVTYASIGSSVIRKYAKQAPKVGLINNGTEDKKGTEIHKEVNKRLREDKNINFIGNIEPRELIASDANVIVTDGWSGNMVVKSYEGMGRQITNEVKKGLSSGFLSKFAALLIKEKLKKIFSKFDYREYGASLILGVNGIVLKAHGESDLFTLNNALNFAFELSKSDFIKK
ncbi:MAG: phosphate acyltransferase PlsX [Mycoplasmataceae bacterium]|nr:phosphate acyltransferase PlsX [Mycoplasmataceae bacterium]